MKSLQFRLLFGIALLLALALGGFGTLAYLSAARDNRAELDALLSTKAFALARLMDAKHNRVAPFLEQGLELDRDGCFLQVFAANGELLARSANLAETIPLSPATGKISPERLNAVLEETRDSHGRPVRLATFSRNEFPGGDDNHVGAADFFLLREKAVNARDADVEHALDAVTHQLRRQRGFFGNRDIARSGGHHEDEAIGVGRKRFLAHDNQFRNLVIFRFRHQFFNRSKLFGGCPRRQNIVRALIHPLDDLRHLCRRFSGTENRFRRPAALCAVMINFGESHFFEQFRFHFKS